MNRSTTISIISLIAGVALGIIIGCQMKADGQYDAQERTDTISHVDTITYIDTVYFVMPVAKDSVIVRHKTITDTTHIIVNNIDTIVVSSYNIPIVQKEYKDSVYHAWVSGYEPSLDSIRIFQKSEQILNTKQINVIKTLTKNKRWGLGISGGFGYTGSGFQPYIGIGLQYNIFTW